ncbi:hypothetical protein SLA2020_433430 [Shorea laevis]
MPAGSSPTSDSELIASPKPYLSPQSLIKDLSPLICSLKNTPPCANSETFAQLGGADEGEDPRKAAIRELREETGVPSAEFLAEAGTLLADL